MRRHSLPYLDMDYCVQLAFDNVNAPEEIGPAPWGPSWTT